MTVGRLFVFILVPFIVLPIADSCFSGPPAPPPPPPTTGGRCGQRTANLEEEGDHYEGDMILPEGSTKVTTNNPSRRWPNRVVPYTIEGSYSSSEKNAINQGASNFGTRTGGCVRWIPRTSQSDYVAITSDSAGCFAYVGRQGGRQVLNLQRGGCLRAGTIEHEMLHSLGVWHEQSRPDRDQYVRINYGNIRPGRESQFEKKNPSQVLLHGGYDYGSVMHYSRCGFSDNGFETITPTNPSATIGQRTGMSQVDVNKLMSFYQC